MKELVCQNNSSGTSSPFMVTDSLGKLFKGINIARQRVWGNHLRETKSVIRRQFDWRNYSEQMTENKIVLKLSQSPQKEKHSHI